MTRQERTIVNGVLTGLAVYALAGLLTFGVVWNSRVCVVGTEMTRYCELDRRIDSIFSGIIWPLYWLSYPLQWLGQLAIWITA